MDVNEDKSGVPLVMKKYGMMKSSLFPHVSPAGSARRDVHGNDLADNASVSM
jgi:hypothetical protein